MSFTNTLQPTEKTNIIQNYVHDCFLEHRWSNTICLLGGRPGSLRLLPTGPTYYVTTEAALSSVMWLQNKTVDLTHCLLAINNVIENLILLCK